MSNERAVRCTATAATAILAAVALVFLMRRLSGALTSPLDPFSLLLVGLVLTLAAAGTRTLWRRSHCRYSLRGCEEMGTGSEPNRMKSATQAIREVPVPISSQPLRERDESFAERKATMGTSLELLISVAVLLTGLALSVPGTAPVALVVFWGLLLGESAWAWLPMLRRNQPHDDGRERPASDDVAAAPSREVVQQMSRRRTDGGEAVCGWLRVPLAAGQRVASAHVAFCPPLATSPQMTVRQSEGPAAQVKIVQLLPYGARLDIKLDAPAEEAACAMLEFTASS